jgi:hypothetical protein
MNTDISWCKKARRLRRAFLYACKFALTYGPSAVHFAGVHGRAPRRHFGAGGRQKNVSRRIQYYTKLQRLPCNRVLLHPPSENEKSGDLALIVAHIVHTMGAQVRVPHRPPKNIVLPGVLLWVPTRFLPRVKILMIHAPRN